VNDTASTRSRFSALAALRRSRGLGKLLAMMALSFLVIFVVGVLRPIRDAIALDGLGAGDFYQVYFVSAIVVLFVPPYNRLADRIAWKNLIPGVALFFAASMVLFRFLYRPHDTVFGMVFYGWYDVMVAALVTQFFMATQVFYNARDAKRAYPLVIAAGSLGAAIGGGITAFFAQRLGTPNLLLVAAAVIVVFAIGIGIVWAREDPEEGRPRDSIIDRDLSAGELKRIFSHPQVRLIATTVLLTVLVKQFVDYEYKTLTAEVYRDVDAMSGFLGLVDAATQWLPILVLLSLRPILRRWGAGVAVMIFPVAMMLATGALAAAMTLPVAVVARTSERMFRYSAERTGREILYVPVPGNIKLKAKAYIDVAVEKGLGKVLAGVIILVLSLAMGGMPVRQRLVVVAIVGVVVAAFLLVAFLRARREYVTTLARSFEGRFANLKATFVSLTGTGSAELVRAALTSPSPPRTAFALDLVEQGDEEDVARFSGELRGLLSHPKPDIRRRAVELLSRAPGAIDLEVLRERLRDPDAGVREMTVRVLAASTDRDPVTFMSELLESPDPHVRSATLASLAHDASPEIAERIVRPFFEARRDAASSDDDAGRLELATAIGLVPGAEGVVDLVRALMDHPDDEVACAAVRSAGELRREELVPDLLRALGAPRTRAAARAALTARGEPLFHTLLDALNDPGTDPPIRRNLPGVLADIASDDTIAALIDSYSRPETEQGLDNRILAALSRLRSAHPELGFPSERVQPIIDREVRAALRYGRARRVAETLEGNRYAGLLARTLREAESERRESLFRWLGLLHPQAGMYRGYLAIESGDDRAGANAIEWLESTIGHAAYTRLSPVLVPNPPPPTTGTATGDGVLRELWDDEDAWLARCALWTSLVAKRSGMLEALEGYDPIDPGLRRAVRHVRARADGSAPTMTEEGNGSMDLIEKVFMLQNVDLLSGARSQQLALLASIAREVEADEDRVLIRKGEATDALYVVLDGEVELAGVGDQTVRVADEAPFGTWALIDREPSLVEARTTRPTRLLRIARSDFRDLLVDHPELGLDLLEGLARRVRTLVPS